jgi:hypothetical protein
MVADVSLQNLIPMPSRWGMTTKAIRVPLEFLEDIYAMIEDKVAQLKIAIGNDTPADQTEDEWVAEITGLPVGFKTGDELPTEIVEAIAEVKSKQTPQQLANEITNQRHDPNYGTHEWIDMMEASPGGKWNWREYLKMVQQEARDGFEAAKEELAILKLHGWLEPNFRCKKPSNKGFGNTTTTKPVDRQQAKRDRRKTRADKNPAVAKTNYKPKQLTPLERFNYDRAVVFTKTVEDTRDELAIFLNKINNTFERGKLEQYLDFLEANFWVAHEEERHCTSEWHSEMDWFKEETKASLDSKFGKGKPGGNNAEFVRLVTILIDAWENADREVFLRTCGDLPDADEIAKIIEEARKEIELYN